MLSKLDIGALCSFSFIAI